MRDVIVSDGRFTTQLAQECPGLEAYIRVPGQEMNPAMAHVSRRWGSTSGLGGDELDGRRSRGDSRGSCRRWHFVGVTGQVEALAADQGRRRDRGDSRGSSLRGAGLHDAARRLAHGESEKDVADALEGYLRRCGATGSELSADRRGGRAIGSTPRRPTTTTMIGQDDFVLVDWGATGRPYKSDLTRVLVTGKVTAKFEAIYRTVLTAQERGIAAIRPGVKAHDVDAEARSVIEEAGFGRFFDHGLGHGLGMDIHEAPRLRKESNVALEPGMVITVEPGVYLPDWGGIRIEDDVLVTPDGCEVLSHVPKSLDSVRIE